MVSHKRERRTHSKQVALQAEAADQPDRYFGGQRMAAEWLSHEKVGKLKSDLTAQRARRTPHGSLLEDSAVALVVRMTASAALAARRFDTR
jgi:hypothetical protein